MYVRIQVEKLPGHWFLLLVIITSLCELLLCGIVCLLMRRGVFSPFPKRCQDIFKSIQFCVCSCICVWFRWHWEMLCALHPILYASCNLTLVPELENHINVSFSFAAALIRGNRKNCAQFSGSLDWLISRLERLEASSGMFLIFSFVCMVFLPVYFCLFSLRQSKLAR